MAENTPETAVDSAPETEDYDVVLLVEQALSEADARQVRSLHEGLDVAVTYHVLLPVEDAAAQVAAALGNVSGDTLVPTSVVPSQPVDFDEIREDAEHEADRDLAATLAALEATGATAEGETVSGDPVDALRAKVAAVDGREAIILTTSHAVSEFFHVDWTSQARRHLGVPVLHLLEHETFDEQAGGGEGASLI